MEIFTINQDVWLIEMVGGPYTDEDCGTSCPNYTFADLTGYYWPALIAGVQEYSGKNQVDYVGFSNGCRVGISSLDSHSSGGNNVGYYFDYQTGQYLYSDLSSNPVNTFVAMACPGNFSGNGLFADCFEEYGEEVIDYFETNNIMHPTQREFALRIAHEAPKTSPCYYLQFFLHSEGRMSENLAEQYYNWITSDQDEQPGSNLEVYKYVSIYGTNGYALDNDNDYLVSIEDQLGILNVVTSSNKVNHSRHLRHNQIPNDDEIRDIVLEELE